MKFIWFVILTLGFMNIHYMLPSVTAAVKNAYGESHFKCSKADNCKKRCGQFCRTFGKCEMCTSEKCGDCVFSDKIR